MCSHNFAIRYFVSTINPANKKSYPSYNCSDYSAGKCERNLVNYMGYYVNPKVYGVFHLKTTSNKQYDDPNLYNFVIQRISDRALEFLQLNFDFEFEYD